MIRATAIDQPTSYVQLRRDDLDARFPDLLDALLKSLPG
ncbi:ArsR family transcriptional regulator [Streptomyces sp. R41]|uniref:ArsR family transcriptional regulator n=1 Tax=Streptomyces sp. R41 TaxID=3238632 RepID=A0AB39RKE5_9ACTN